MGLVVLVAASLAACGGDDETTTTSAGSVGPGGTPSSSTSASETGSGGAGASAGDGGAGTGPSASGGAGSGGDPSGNGGSSAEGTGGGPVCEVAPLGPDALEDVAAEDCEPVGGTPVAFGDPELFADYFSELITVGARRAAGGVYVANGPILLDADGASASEPLVLGATSVASRDGELGVLISGPAIQRFDEDGVEIGGLEAAAEVGGPQAIAADDAGWLLAWVDAGNVNARAYDADLAPRGDAMPVIEADPAWLVAAGSGESIGLAIEDGGSMHFARFTGGELDGVLVDAVCSPNDITPVAIAAREGGWVLLARLADADEPSTILVALDADGAVDGAARRIEGFFDPTSIAVNGSVVMITGTDADNVSIVRPFDSATLDPAGPPVCLNGEVNGYPAAADAEGEGFAFLYATDDGTQQLVVFTDASGAGI